MKAADYKRETGDELLGILRYWMENSPDWKQGGFLGRIDASNRRYPDAPKGLQLNSSILWTFSAASWFARNDIYLAVARRAYEYISSFFIDTNGGAWWSLDAKGQPLDTRKVIEGQASLIYGLSEYYYAADDLVALRQAISLFRFIESQLAPAATPDPATNLQLLEAYTNLYHYWPDDQLRQQIILLLSSFDCSTSYLPGAHYGLDIQAAWMLQRSAGTIGDVQWIEKTAASAIQFATIATEGLDIDGGLWDKRDTDHRGKQDWVQAEAIIGFLHAWEVSGDDIWWRRSTACWKYIRHNPTPDQDRAGFFIWPTHKARACMEIVRRLTDRERAVKSII